MKRSVYLIQNEEKSLVLTDVDKDGNIILSIDYVSEPAIETHSVYDAENRLLEEICIQDGVEVSKHVYTYNSEGKILKQQMYINTELVEEMIFKHFDKGTERKTFQDGTLSQKWIQQEIDENNTLTEFYEGEKLIETNLETFDSTTNTYTIQIFNEDKKLIITRINISDSEGMVLASKELDNHGELIRETIYEPEGKYIKKAYLKDYEREIVEEVHEYEYDENWNVVFLKIVNGKGTPIAFHESVYNEDNLLVEEKGWAGNKLIPINLPYLAHGQKEFHFIHEYE